jgi:signal transduction histidine kinase
MLTGAALLAEAATIFDRASVIVQRKGDASPRAPVDTTLPYRWDAEQSGTEGKARFLLPFSYSGSAEPQALFIVRVGNTYEVTLNGVVLGTKGAPGDPYADNKKPVFFNIPPGLLRDKNLLTIDINAQNGRHAGLTPVVFGPAEEVRELYRASWRERITGYFVMSIISGVLGALALLLWLRQHERMYVYYGLSELLFAFRISDPQFDVTPLAWPWWGIAGFSAQAIASALIWKFVLSVMDRHHGAIRHICTGFLLLTLPVMLLSLFGGLPELVSAWKGISALISITVAVIVVPQGLRSRVSEQRIVAVAFLVVIVALVRDTLVFKNLPGYYGVVWAVYGWILFSISMAWIIAERLRKSTQAVARMNHTLAARLLEREAELAAMYKHQADAERLEAMVEERQRLTRDMHDGLGSQLLGALHLAQNPEVPKEALALQLRDALDQLKLTVDAMQDTEGDITTLLGSLRYRLGPRLKAAGVELAWDVNPLPAIPGWTLQHSRDLQMLLFEAFSNIIVHAGASRACLRAVADSDRIRITLGDNGRGFDAGGESAGHGLRNMRARAARLGAELDIQATAGGTQVGLSLPIREAVA